MNPIFSWLGRRRARAVLSGWLGAALFLLSTGCGRLSPGPVRLHLAEPFPEKLSQWGLFLGGGPVLKPNKGVVPYDLNTPLFSDYANKHRFIWMPPGTSALYHENDAFQFPVGTIISKTFSYSYALREKGNTERLLETRLLVHTARGWVGLPYVWNERQTDATLQIAGENMAVAWTHPSGESYKIDYVVPNVNQCKGCHENAKQMGPIGPKARHLNREYGYAEGRANQLIYWTRIGYLKNAPTPDQAPRAPVWDDPASGALEARVRAYLDINCAHCHNPAGPANTSGLYLSANVTDPHRLGFCKAPVATGRGSGDLLFGMVPGKPEESILVHRMNSTTPKVMMPELGRTLVHKEGVALIRDWIASTSGDCESGGPVPTVAKVGG